MGPAWLHNRYRKTRSGQSVFNKVLRAMNLLKKHYVDVNILTVVNNVTAEHPQEIYEYLTHELKAEFVQFIPAVRTASGNEKYGELLYPQTLVGSVTEWSVSGEQWGTIYDRSF
ncbi:Anaerobic sulfatase-maturating enzyme [Kluyvera cryocrescens]|uniref:Anaerobic sulfatase-maturating enzyme n=1 Tax=Kluyvera cryocrescens TaxID=580 RepID=A0A485BQV3_KLUCR|nr:Anaerobic sulfatase-maturating enzyme [Kluyvera cryocrescens]